MIGISAALPINDTWSRGDLIAFLSLIFGIVAVYLALWTLHRGNRNSSVATMIPLNAEIRGMWERYRDAFTNIKFSSAEELTGIEQDIQDKLESLMNVLEIAAAIEVEGTLTGASDILMRDFLSRILDTLISDDYTNSQVSGLLQDNTTYLYIRRFLHKNVAPNTVLPPQWYAYPKVSTLQALRDKFRN